MTARVEIRRRDQASVPMSIGTEGGGDDAFRLLDWIAATDLSEGEARTWWGYGYRDPQEVGAWVRAGYSPQQTEFLFVRLTLEALASDALGRWTRPSPGVRAVSRHGGPASVSQAGCVGYARRRCCTTDGVAKRAWLRI